MKKKYDAIFIEDGDGVSHGVGDTYSFPDFGSITFDMEPPPEFQQMLEEETCEGRLLWEDYAISLLGERPVELISPCDPELMGVKTIFDDIVVRCNLTDYCFKIFYEEYGEGAHVTVGNHRDVFISQSQLNKMTTNAELYAVLLHELGHLILGHTFMRDVFFYVRIFQY